MKQKFLLYMWGSSLTCCLYIFSFILAILIQNIILMQVLINFQPLREQLMFRPKKDLSRQVFFISINIFKTLTFLWVKVKKITQNTKFLPFDVGSLLRGYRDFSENLQINKNCC